MILALISAASAGTLLSLAPDLQVELLPREAVVPPQAIVPDARYTAVDAHATRTLGEALIDVRPLMMKFDGEIEIMGRLEAAVSEVRVIRDLQERRLMYQALAFEGFAAQRYFQDGLGTEPTAEPYRVVVGDTVEVKAWVDAVALDPYHEPTRADVSEEPELTAFKATRDRLLFSAPALLFIDSVPPGAEVVLDGQVQTTNPAAGFRVYPGRHHLTVSVSDVIVERDDFPIAAGELRHLTVPPSKKELDDLTTALGAGPDRVTLTDAMHRALIELPAPVRVAAPGPEGALYFRLDDDELFRIDADGSTDAERSINADVRIWIGAAVLHDPGFAGNSDAPDGFTTLNAGAADVGAAAVWHLPLPVPTAGKGHPIDWIAGLGADVIAPGGTWHALPVGDRDVRLRVDPYLSFGVPFAQITAGIVSPFYAAIGARASLPITDAARLDASFTEGLVAFRGDAPASWGPPRVASIAVSASLK